jgi:Cys-tRNA(Pro) deacylase
MQNSEPETGVDGALIPPMDHSHLPEPTRRVLEAAHRYGMPVILRMIEQTTHKAEDAAKAIGCPVELIVKSLLFTGLTTKKPYLFLVSGKRRINEKRVAEQLGEVVAKADLASVQKVTGFEIGGVAPIGLKTAITVLIDESLMEFGQVWCAAGTDGAVFAVNPMLLARATRARILKL